MPALLNYLVSNRPQLQKIVADWAAAGVLTRPSAAKLPTHRRNRTVTDRNLNIFVPSGFDFVGVLCKFGFQDAQIPMFGACSEIDGASALLITVLLRLRATLPWLLALVFAVVSLYYARFDIRIALGITPRPPESSFRSVSLEVQHRMDRQILPGRFIFIGNSIIHSLYTDNVVEHAVNFGIGGDTTTTLLDRLQNYSSLNTAAGIIVEVGVNDLASRNVTLTVQGWQAILAALPPRVPVYAVGVLPVREDHLAARIVGKTTNAKIAETNAGIRNLCFKAGNCHFIDTSELGGPSGLLSEYDDGDGIHLSGAGYAALTAILRRSLPSQVHAL